MCANFREQKLLQAMSMEMQNRCYCFENPIKTFNFNKNITPFL